MLLESVQSATLSLSRLSWGPQKPRVDSIAINETVDDIHPALP